MPNLSKKLQLALDAGCAHSIEDLLKDKKDIDFKALFEMLAKEYEPQQRLTRAIYLLGRWGDRSAADTIIKTIPHLDEGGKVTAMDALGRLGSEQALNTIIRYSKDTSPNVRKFVAHALKRFETKNALACLKQIAKEDKSDFVKETARKIIGGN